MRQIERRLVFIVFILAAAGVVVLDQIVKRLVTGHLLLFQSIPVAKGWLNLVYVHNTGVAFGKRKGHHKESLGNNISTS